jgi:hypothetical protein
MINCLYSFQTQLWWLYQSLLRYSSKYEMREIENFAVGAASNPAAQKSRGNGRE